MTDHGLDAWWVIHGEVIMEALIRVHQGDDPGAVYAELYANSEHERPEVDLREVAD